MNEFEPIDITFSSSFLANTEFAKPPAGPKPPKGGSKPIGGNKDTGVNKKHTPASGKK